MRGTKAKQLRKYATQAIQHGLSLGVIKSGDTQTLSSPMRYLYQFLKGRNSNLTIQLKSGG